MEQWHTIITTGAVMMISALGRRSLLFRTVAQFVQQIFNGPKPAVEGGWLNGRQFGEDRLRLPSGCDSLGVLGVRYLAHMGIHPQ